MLARKTGALLVALLAVATVAWAGPAAKLLIVDRTQTFMESMQLEVLARALLASGEFEIAATTEVPSGSHPRGPFQFVVIVPQGGKWVWVCTPAFPSQLSLELQGALGALKGAIDRVFQGRRQALDPADDLYVVGWSAYFLKIGVLERLGG